MIKKRYENSIPTQEKLITGNMVLNVWVSVNLYNNPIVFVQSF